MADALIFGQTGGLSITPPTYTGTWEFHQSVNPTTKKPRAYIILKTSGTLNFPSNVTADIQLVGAGVDATNGDSSYGWGGNGGKGGKRIVHLAQALTGGNNIPVVIGAPSDGNTTFAALSSATGAASNGGNGGTVSGASMSGTVGVRVFNGDVAPFDVWWIGGGGSGGKGSGTPHAGIGGWGGGGMGSGSTGAAGSGVDNTGGGGGGPSNQAPTLPGRGGTGVVIVRWGDWSA